MIKKKNTPSKNNKITTKKSKLKLPKKKKTGNKKTTGPKKETTPVVIVPAVVEEKKKKVKGKMYFTQETQDAIVQYNNETDENKRNDIYNEKIKYAFEKLVENIFNTFKFTYFEAGPLDTQKEVLTHLVTNMHKYQAEKGKAFGYFSIVAKHYLIFHNNTNYKRFNQHVNVSDTPSETTICLQSDDPYHKDVELNEFMTMMIDYWEKNITKVFPKKKDLTIAEAVVELFRNYKRIECFNKKALYFYIREMSNCRTQQITKILSRFKLHQDTITKLYRENGTFSATK